jgi:hypothetical protein
MGKKKKEIRIIRKDSIKQDYTFISNDNILNNTKNNESTNTSIIFSSFLYLLYRFIIIV